MGKHSDSESRIQRKSRHVKSRPSLTSAHPPVPRRARISNFDRPPQPPELQKLTTSYDNTDRKFLLGVGPETTKQARRIFIGNLSRKTSEQGLRDEIARILVDWGGIVHPGDPVVTTLYVPDLRCIMMELRSVEETEAALTLNGMLYDNHRIEIRRPADYWNYGMDYHKQVVVPRVNLNKIGLISPFVDDEFNKVFIGGLPLDLEEEQIKEILGAYGQLKAFKLARNEEDSRSLGYAFCEYVDNTLAERVALALNGCEFSKAYLGNKTLLVRKVISSEYEQELVETSLGIFRGEGPDFSLITQYPGGCIQPNFETIMHRNRPITVAEFIRAKQTIESLQHRAKEIAQDRALREAELFASGVGPPGIGYDHRSYEDIPGLNGLPCVTGNLFPSLNYQRVPEGSSNVICVEGMVDPIKSILDNEFAVMYEEIMHECVKYGTVVALVIPRECEGFYGSCIGKVYVEYIDQSSAVRACSQIVQDLWKDTRLKAYFYEVSKFHRNELD